MTEQEYKLKPMIASGDIQFDDSGEGMMMASMVGNIKYVVEGNNILFAVLYCNIKYDIYCTFLGVVSLQPYIVYLSSTTTYHTYFC